VKRPAVLLLLFVVLAACGASAREKALRTSFVAVTTLQAGFEAWDKEHQLAIVEKASSYEAGAAEIEAYWKKRTDVTNGFEAAYRTIAAALIADEKHTLTGAKRAYDQLVQALTVLTGGKLP
jgi:hypothetical protein